MFAERGYRGTTVRDIAQELGIQGLSLYNHMHSKQEILRDTMFSTTEQVFAAQRVAIAGVDDVAEQLRRAAEAYARLAIRYRREVLITHREITSLDKQDQALVSSKTKEYVRGFRVIVERGYSLGRFSVKSPHVASFAILEMLNGLEKWFRETGMHSENEIVCQYGDFALRIVGARDGQGN